MTKNSYYESLAGADLADAQMTLQDDLTRFDDIAAFDELAPPGELTEHQADCWRATQDALDVVSCTNRGLGGIGSLVS